MESRPAGSPPAWGTTGAPALCGGDGRARPLAIAVAVAAVGGQQLGAGSRYALIALLALAMGVQNATARRLADADLTTTVLTLTLTGIAADSWLGGGSGARTARRVLAVAAMLLGAFVGALLLTELRPVAPLVLATALLALVTAAAGRRRAADSRAASAT